MLMFKRTITLRVLPKADGNMGMYLAVMLTLDRNEGVGMSRDGGAGVGSKESIHVANSLAT
jgi:hypothetical protein